MITLRQLANSKDNEYSLSEWIELAGNAGLSIDSDVEINTDMLLQLRAYMSQQTQKKQAEQDEQARKEAASMKSMERLIQENYVFVDLSSLLVPAAEKAFRRMAPLLKASSKKLNIPKSAVLGLRRIAEDQSDLERCRLAVRHHNALGLLNKNNLLAVRDAVTPDECNCTKDLITYCSHFRMRESLLVITQDEQLAADLISLNQQRSANGKAVTVKKINKYGYLSNTIDRPRSSKPFSICKEVRPGGDRRIPVSVIPSANDKVYTSPDLNGEVVLLDQLGSGGEGAIYKTNTPFVAKVYKEECCTEYRFEKLNKMIRAGLKYEGICFPLALLYNRYGQPVGYLMPEARGYSIQSSIFRKALFVKKLPGWKKEDLVQCAITILYQIKFLHDNNILIGDINPNNFLVVSPTEVYLVDTDSFQIDDLPCPVGFPLFTAPEIHMQHRQGKFSDYAELLRSKENEYFAVATLIFMLMMPGKPPYTQQGGEDIVDNILEMHFPYAVGERHGENVPEGTWRFIWSHLTRKMKENFLKVFNKEDANSDFNISERLSVEQWKKELIEYKRVIKMWEVELDRNPLTLEVDPYSLELYPTRLKHRPRVQYVICKGDGCDKEYAIDDSALKAGYCPDCQRKGTPAKCWYDGKEFIFTNYEKYYKKMSSPPLLCPDCRKDNAVVYSKECAVSGCENKIEYTKYDTARAMQKAAEGNYKFEYPKMCKSCKAIGRKLNSDKNSPHHRSSYNNNTNSGSGNNAVPAHPSSGTEGCFITTAVCGYLGKADDCAELTNFRFFRDTWLQKQPEGKELIEEYYRIAPGLVRRMHESPAYKGICQTLWDDYLVPCHHMILDNEYEDCEARYIDMVHYLRSALGE